MPLSLSCVHLCSFSYTPAQLQRAATHDRLWNGIQQLFRRTGVLHSAVQRYWLQRLLQWTRSDAGLALAMSLVEKYALARDAKAELLDLLLRGVIELPLPRSKSATHEAPVCGLGQLPEQSVEQLKDVLGPRGVEQLLQTK
eukprot:PLAT9095.1.p2 GENE.PLAT9095.1~~PLAT9095.1.p2  ORF type:complete len:141 (-),score=41.46 PLAT9095.1:18-440(-)